MARLPTDSTARLNDAFNGRRCVSAWLGHGDVLFLGFGESVLPVRDSEGVRSEPQFELQTNLAAWSVTGPDISVSSDPEETDRQSLEAAAESLIGEQVVSWALRANNFLSLAFTGGKMLHVIPWELAFRLSDAWSVSSVNDGLVFAVATDGSNVVVSALMPVRDWFGPK
jgi:hypothetical protein